MYSFQSQMMGTMIVALVIGLLIGIAIMVFFLLNLQNAMKQVGEPRRLVPPANVWLLFIPLFSIVYQFILYPKISDSIKAEYEHRGMKPEGDFARTIGITMAVLGVVGLIRYAGAIQAIGTLAGLANFVLMIIYWVKIANYKNKLASTPSDGVVFGGSSDLLDN